MFTIISKINFEKSIMCKTAQCNAMRMEILPILGTEKKTKSQYWHCKSSITLQ